MYTEEEMDVLKDIDRYQSDGREQKEVLRPRQSSTDAGTSTSGTKFACAIWVSKISIKKLKIIAKQLKLSIAITWPSLNDRLHNLPPCMVAFYEAIIWGGASIPLRPFLVEVLDYFNLVPFQLTPNSLRTIVSFYIAFMETDIGESSAEEFTYVYYI